MIGIGIDVGNGMTKTVNSVFRSGVVKYDTKPSMPDNIVSYNGKYYGVGGKRSTTKTDNKQDETAFVLALAGIAEELKKKNITDCEIVLSEGLPIERCTQRNKEIEERYYKQGETILFEYEDVPYSVKINKVLVNPQGVSAVLKLMLENTLPDPCIVIDLGSWTMDVVVIKGNKPEVDSRKSFNMGVIECFNNVNSRIRTVTGNDLDEYVIEKIMRGERGLIQLQYENMILDDIGNYIKSIYNKLMEERYNVALTPCIFVGGGASVLKTNGSDKYFPTAKYVTNISANAYGYEIAAHSFMKKYNS